MKGIFRALFLGLLFFLPSDLLAEGTRQLMPSSTDHGYIQIYDLNTLTRPFAGFNCPADDRLNITICQPGEIIYMGFRQTDNDVFFQLRAPNGDTVVIPGLTPVAGLTKTYRLPAAGMGRIGNYTQAFNGPSALAAGGYNAMSYVSTMAGEYYVEFNPVSPTVITPVKRLFTYFDITVASPANVKIDGRVWSQTWDFSTNGGNNRFRAIMYVYSDDGIVTALNCNGMRPHGFTMSCNATGCTDTGDPAADRRSRFGNATYPQYKIFLNNPDENCFPTGSFGDLTLDPTITGCGGNRCINISVDKPGNIAVLLDLNGSPGYNPGTVDRQLFANVVVGTNCVPWDGLDGLGNVVATGINITLQIDYFNGITHLPLHDVEHNDNGYIVTLVRPIPTIPTPPRLFWDDAPITTGTASDGLTNFAGCSTPGGCHRWVNRGNNSNPETINTWWYANIITRNINYNNNSINVDADIRNPGSGSANDTTICGLIAPVQLAGAVNGAAAGGEWVSTGTGSFAPSTTAMTGTYTPSQADINNGFVYLKLTSTFNGPCPAVSDSIRVNLAPAPTANAGPNQSICSNSNNATVTLAGSFTVATGAVWSGAGTFVPSLTNMGATYAPTAAEISNGSATVTLTTTGNGLCPAATDQMVITIDPAPTVDAGPAQSICANTTATLAGVVTNATSQTWSAPSGSFNNNAIVNAVYTPAAATTNVTLTLTASKAGCNAVTDQVIITVNAPPTADAGNNQSVCHNNAEVTLAGVTTNSTGITWTGGAGTFTPGNTTLNAVYTPTLAERNSGSVVLTLTATRAGCAPATDPMTITVTPGPVANAGNDELVCANNPTITITTASVTGAAGGTWSGAGGSFVPAVNTINPQYTLSSTEVSNGVTSLILRTDATGNCNPDSDTMQIIVLPAPLPDAGPDQTVCHNNSIINLSGTISSASGSSWSTTTGGSFGNINDLNTTYTPTLLERNAGTVTLTLTATQTDCNPVSDQVTITIEPAPTANAGSDQSVCHNNANVTLNGSSTNATSQHWSGGAGTFTPDNTSLNAVYTPTLAERNNGTVTLILNAIKAGCITVTDAMTISITPAPTVDAGNYPPVCANNPTVTLNGTSSTGSGTWTGTGTFSNSTTLAGSNYTPSAAEITASLATITLTSNNNGNCSPVTDQATISITPAPIPDAGPDQTVCADFPSVTLSGSSTVATGGTWSGGSGSFNPDHTSFNTTYTPTLAEINTGSVTLTMTTTSNGDCNPVSDDITITIDAAPTVNAGADQVVCGNVANVPINGATTVATGATWTSSGTGTFSNANNLSTAYIPSAADLANATVTLTLTTTGTGLCQAVSDQMVITFTSVPSINAGPDQIVCTNDFPVQLNAAGSPATWSGGGGTFSPGASALNATYTPTAAEALTGTVTLTLTTIPSGACPAISDDITITIPQGPLADAGSDATMCGNFSGFTLNGTISNPATGINTGFWTTSGTGSFLPNQSTLNATYNPSALDRTNGSVTLTLSTTGNGPCSGHSDDMILTIQPEIVVNAGPDQTICGDKSDITLGGTVTGATGTAWSSTGSGGFAPGNTDLNATYSIVLPTDTANGSVTFTLTSTGNGICPAVSDNVIYTITDAPKVDAGPDHTICADSASINLAGSVIGSTGGQWTTNGTGSFSPHAAAPNTTYFPSPADRTAGNLTFTLSTTGSGLCNDISDNMILSITPAPTVDAGPDMTICADAGTIPLNGLVTVASGGTWTTSGTGTFNDPNLLNATYNPSSADSIGGLVTLTLTTTGNGLCKEAQDQMFLNLTPVPSVNAGFDQNVCGKTSVSLAGSVTVSSGGTWTSSGTGTFTPNANALNAVYHPSDADTTAGTVTLTLTTNPAGNCNIYSDAIIVTFENIPEVNAGPDQTICADSFYVALAGVVKNAGGGLWSSTGSGTFSTDATLLTANYVPSPSDRTGGSITLTLTTTGTGPCAAIEDEMVLTITPAPTVAAGSDQLICADSAFVNLNGTFTVASGISWTSSGDGGFTPTHNTPNAVYTPSANDRFAGSVTLTATTTGNGTCKAVSENLIIAITPAPTVNAGSDQTICANQASFNLNGTVTVAAGGIWTTTGSGVFGPNNTALNATYFPTSADTAASAVTLTLTTTGNGTCHTYTDQLTLSFDPLPVVDAGPDQTVCAVSSGVELNGSVANGLGGTWSSSGAGGAFSPNTNTIDVSFTPSNADTTAGSVTLTLTSVDNGTCPAITDDVLITFTPIPIIDAGPDQTLCADVEGVQLQGLSINTPSVVWSSNGTGSFSDINNLLAVYAQSPADTVAGSIVVTLTSNGGICAPVSDNMIITFTPAPTVIAGPDLTICPGLPSVSIQGAVTIATGGTWTTSGTGTFADENSLNTTYFPSAADQLSGSFTLSLETTGNGSCSFYHDDMIVTYGPLPPIDAGNDAIVCTNGLPIHLNGSGVSGRWSGGLGTFSPNDSTLNATYTPHPNEITATTVTLTLTSIASGGCATTSDDVMFTINPGPTANAGADHPICTNTPSISLNGVVTNATNGSWTSSGSGTFADASNRITTYVPSNADKTTGSVTFTLKTTGNNGCAPATDRMIVTINPGPTIDAGPSQTVCRNASVNLAASFTLAGGMEWSGALGSFNTSNTDPNAIYTPTAAEHTPGPLTLTATTTNTGICPAVSDQVIITFTPAPTVSAGPAQNVCANAASVSLDGTVTIASGGFWSGGTGVFSPGPSTIDPSYTPTAADTIAGSVTLTLSSTGNGTCNPVTNTVTITFAPVPVVNAGANDTICSGEASIALVGQISNAAGGQWTTFGTGTFNPNNTTLITAYEHSAQDHLNGAVNLMLTSTGPGPCAAVSDVKTVTIFTSPSASVNAGFNQTICADASEVSLNGFIDIASGGIWSTNGSGNFLPSTTDLNARYVPSAADTTAGTVTLTLTSVGNGFCTPVSDDMIVTINKAPIAIANTPATICADAIGATISGAVYNAGGGVWSSSGSGSFSPDASSLTATYIPSSGDKSIGSANLTLTTTGIGTCHAVSNTVTLNIRKVPTVNAGPDQVVCANTAAIPISGSFTDATGSTWTTSGNGSFGNAASSSTIYLPSSDDTTAGAVNLRLTTTTGIGTCAPVFDHIRITFNKFPVATAGPDQTVCASGPGITLINGSVANASGGQWSTTGSGTFSNTTALNATYLPSDQDKNSGTVTLTLTTTGNGGCTSDFDDMILTIQAAPQVNAGDPVICEVSAGAALSGTFSNAGGIVWSGLGGFSPSPMITNPVYHPSASELAQNSAKVKITTTGNGTCAAVSDSAIISIDPMPVANAGQDEYVCRGSEAILAAQTSPGVTYRWATIANTFISSDPTATVIINNDATFVLTVTNAKLCSSSDTVIIRTYELPTFELDPHHCLSNNLLVDSDPQNLPVVPGVYQWYRNDGILTGQDKTIIFPIEDGMFKIRYSYGNCFVDSSTNVTRPPVLSHIDFTACSGSSNDIIINSNVTNVNYVWSTGNAGVDLNTINQTVPLDTTFFKATVTDGLGCISLDSVRTIGIPTPNWNFPDDSSCIGLAKLLDGRPDNILNIDNLNPVYQWFKNNVDQNHTNDTLPVTETGTYVVQVKIDRCVNSDTANIKFNPNPATVLPDKLKFCKETENQIILDGGEGNGYTYLWTAPAGIFLDSNNTRTTAVRNEGFYKVIVTNLFDCPSEDSIFVDEICPPRIHVPNAFTPGISGGDQKFRVFGANLASYKLEIFNRWGEVIFLSTDRSEGWDGSYHGVPMPIGVYSWIVTYEGEAPDFKGPYRETGSVTIIR